MQKLRHLMAQAIDEDMDLEEAIDRHDFPEWQRVRLYGLNHRINLSFVYREMEQEMF